MKLFSFVCVVMLYATSASWAQVESVASDAVISVTTDSVTETATTPSATDSITEMVTTPATDSVVESVATPVSAPSITPEAKVVFVPGVFDIQQKDNDMKILREKGEKQSSNGSVMLFCGVGLIPIGLGLIVFNFQDYMDYSTSNDMDGRESAVLAFTAGDVALTAGVILTIVGVVVKNSGDKKIKRADEYEKMKTAMNVRILPIADVANKRGGLMLSANF